ncbi:MAG: pyridoxal phosphate-dependent aminotransferase [Verrucomicrobiota bacterium]|nr:pyridoxal phosphate-dependent aminotransferase [Verrucomicrobiota bacterium]
MSRAKHSDYMEWAKLHSHARFNLATSGLISVTREEFDFHGELEITRAGDYGYRPLQERLAEHAGVSPECIVAADGTSMANHLAMAAVLEPGDEVLVEEPSYVLLLELASFLGARIKRFQRKAENGFAIDLDEIQAQLTPQTRLIVLTNLHNPSGALISRETLSALGEIALRAKTRVLVDEVYLEMLFDDEMPGAFSIGQTFTDRDENPFMTTNSLTKAYGLSGLRCGWIIASPELARRIWRLNDLFSANSAHPAEQLSVSALEQLPRFRARAQTLLKTNRPLLNQFLDSRPELDCFRPCAGTVIFPRLLQGDAEELVRLLREKFETSVVPGNFFEKPQHFRIGIGGETANVQGGLERLGKALDALS